MLKVIVKNKQGVETNSSEAVDATAALAWLNQESSNKSFGKNERWIRESEIDPSSENIEDALESRDVELKDQSAEGPIAYEKEYRFAADWTYELVDITEEVADRNMDSELTKDDEACKKVLNVIRRYNKKHVESNAIMTLMGTPDNYPILFAILLGAVPQLRVAVAQVGPSIYPQATVDEALAILDQRIAERPA